MIGKLGAATTAWMDRAWDGEAGLLLNPPGSFEGAVEARTVHLVRETAWYAIGLLRRDGPGDRARAAQAIEAVLDHQYDEPGTPWHGTFVRFPEWPAPREGAVEWVDFDPNWRQFVGSALAVTITDFDLPAPLVERARDAVHLAVDAEPPDRVPPTYANIALLRAWLESWAGRPGDDFARAVVEAFRTHGCFLEYGSPTYYGIDLLALGLWQRKDAPDRLRRDGAEVEAALWTDIARWWHAGLGNLCGPYSRAYGMDAHRYVSGLSLALWCAGLPAPMPPLTGGEVPHGHDLCEGPMLEHLGVRIPAAARRAFVRFQGERSVHQVVATEPRREASGWLEEGLMVGAETGSSGLHARGQFHPATIHWRQPDGSVGWLRLQHHGPTRAVAERRRLTVECDPHPRRGPQALEWIGNGPWVVDEGTLRMPGLEVRITTNAAGRPLRYEPASRGTTTFTLELTPVP